MLNRSVDQRCISLEKKIIELDQKLKTISQKIACFEQVLDGKVNETDFTKKINNLSEFMAGYCSFKHIQDLQEDINPKVNFCLGKVNEFYKKTNEFSETLARFDEVLLLKASKLSLDELKNVVETKTNCIEVKQFEQKYNDKFEDFIDDLYNINSKIDHVYDKIQESLKHQIFQVLGDKPIEIEDVKRLIKDKVDSGYLDDKLKSKVEQTKINNYDEILQTINKQFQHLVVIIQSDFNMRINKAKTMDNETYKCLCNINKQLSSIQNWVCSFDVHNQFDNLNKSRNSIATNTEIKIIDEKDFSYLKLIQSEVTKSSNQLPIQDMNTDITKDLLSPRNIDCLSKENLDNLVVYSSNFVDKPKVRQAVRNSTNLMKIRTKLRMNQDLKMLQSQLNVSMNELTDKNSERSCLKAFPINHLLKDRYSNACQTKTPVEKNSDLNNLSEGIEGVKLQNSVRKSVDSHSNSLLKINKSKFYHSQKRK